MENFDESVSVISEEKSSSDSSFSKRRKKKSKICWLCKWGCLHVDYKNVEFLKRYLKNNRIITHKITGNCLKHQHQISDAIKRARIVALLPFLED